MSIVLSVTTPLTDVIQVQRDDGIAPRGNAAIIFGRYRKAVLNWGCAS